MLCFGLSTTLLLAAMCSLMAAVPSVQRAVTCEGDGGNVQRLSCGYGVIRVKKVLYGRQDSEICAVAEEASGSWGSWGSWASSESSKEQPDTDCSQDGTVNVLKSRCDGRKECELNITLVSDPDPCSDTSKYLDTTYSCFPATHLTVCEGSVAYLQCTPGQVISVYGAHYGRTDRTICSFRNSTDENTDPTAMTVTITTDTVDCFNSVTKIVSDRCNEKNSCTIDVSDTQFKDPCETTYKYLEVAYVCEYPKTYYYRRYHYRYRYHRH